MQILLNTIMLEVNRWTPDHRLTRPLMDLLDPVREASFDALELWQYHISALEPDEVERLAQKLRSLDMRALALGAYPAFHLKGTEAAEMEAGLDRLLSYAVTLGVTTFKIFPGRIASAETDARTWDCSVRRIAELAAKLAARGMTLSMETHGNTLCDTLESVQHLLADLSGMDNVGLCFQPYTDHDTDQAIAAFDAVRSAIVHIHLQNRRTADSVTTLLEEGDWIDYARFLRHVRESDFDDLLCIEFTAGIFPPQGEAFDPQVVIDNAVRDREFVSKIWNVPRS